MEDKENKVVSWIKKIFIRSVYCVTCCEKKDVCIVYECRKVPPRRKELLKRAEERATRAREEHERQERNKQPLLRLLGESDQG